MLTELGVSRGITPTHVVVYPDTGAYTVKIESTIVRTYTVIMVSSFLLN